MHLVLDLLLPRPYPWQRRLHNEWFAHGRIPEAIDIPTGLGKTKVIAAWLAARAEGAALPRRLVYVVDRRAVVDQATTEAEHLATTLSTILSDESVDAADRARWRTNLSLGDAGELPVSTLRGQHIDNRKWMDRPHGAAIIVGTVDMIGSRLLFSGYGVNPHVRSVHAGLLGCDSLVVLDESHLVPPFKRMLDRVAAIRNIECERNPMIPAFRVLALSATGRERQAEATFRLDDTDRADSRVQARLSAEKRLRVLQTVPSSDLAKSLCERAWELAGDSRRVIIFSNSRKVAQEVEADLARRNETRFGKGISRSELFVGERRLRERMQLYDPQADGRQSSIVPRFLAGSDPGEGPAFLVATSAGEVGVDFDADDLVCDLVPWERMVQRFGRVNRRAIPGHATVVIIPSTSEKDAENEVAVERLKTLIAPFESGAWHTDEEGSLSASPLELDRLKSDPEFVRLTRAAQTPPPFSPTINSDFVDAWSLTTLREHTGRAIVAPFLRGWTDDPPQASIGWRSVFPVRNNVENADREDVLRDLRAFFEAAPPHATELLEAPVDRIAELLKKRAEAYDDGREETHSPLVVCLDNRNIAERVWFLSDLRSPRQKAAGLARDIIGRTLIVDARLGGLAKGLLDLKSADAVATIDGPESLWGIPLNTTAQRRVRSGPFEQPESDWKTAGYRWQRDPDIDDGEEIWVEIWRGDGATRGDAAVTRRAQTLAEHHAWTHDDAARCARELGLPEDKIRMLAAAAGFHDAGKDRTVWQNAMRALSDGRPYAKTTGGANIHLLSGYRHELGSLADAPNCTFLEALPPADRDLALHLIIAHHGRGRPSTPPIEPNLPPMRSRALAAEAALRFARLQRAWGPWGLAWWEALLRAADWSASRRVDETAAP